MKKTGMMMIGAVALFMAGAAVAELPVPTKAPLQGRYGSFDVLRNELESLQGSVVEMIYDQALFQMGEGIEVELRNTPSGIYGAEWRHEYSEYSKVSTEWVSMVFEIPEEGVLSFYHRSAREQTDRYGVEEWKQESVSRKEHWESKSGKAYFYITSEPFVTPFKSKANLPEGWKQALRVTAVGDDFIQNEDGSVRYVWKNLLGEEDLKGKEKWTLTRLSLLEKYLKGSDSVIQIAFGKITDAVKDEVSGEFTGWLANNVLTRYNDPKIRAVFPPEAEPFLEKMNKKKDRDSEITIVYARVEYPLDGELTLRVLGVAKRVRKDNKQYAW